MTNVNPELTYTVVGTPPVTLTETAEGYLRFVDTDDGPIVRARKYLTGLTLASSIFGAMQEDWIGIEPPIDDWGSRSFDSQSKEAVARAIVAASYQHAGSESLQTV